MAPTVVLVTDRFQAFSAEHFGLLALFLLVCVALVVVGRRRRGDDTVFRRGFAIVLACVVVPIQVVQLRPWDFDLQSSLPINLCDLAWLCAVYALWTRRPWAVALTYYWGLTLTSQGILTPSLGQQFPDPRYFGFWGLHFLTVWSAVYLVSSGNPPTWRGYRFTLMVTAVWAAGRSSSTPWRAPTTATSTASRTAPRCWTCCRGGRRTSCSRSPSSLSCGR